VSTAGFPDSTVRESRDQVRAAIRNAGLAISVAPITLNLAPADVRKEGAAFDLPTAVGILCATESIGNTSPLRRRALPGRRRPLT
jgi:magnesium chelatase family protein